MSQTNPIEILREIKQGEEIPDGIMSIFRDAIMILADRVEKVETDVYGTPNPMKIGEEDALHSDGSTEGQTDRRESGSKDSNSR